jgi:hypothetical protein
MEQTYQIVELLTGEICYSLKEAQDLAEMWRDYSLSRAILIYLNAIYT